MLILPLRWWRKAREIESATPHGIRYIRGDVSNMDWWDRQPFDGAVCNMALTDIDDLDGVLRTAIVLGALVTIVHFLPTARQESPAVIYGSWVGLPAVGIAAVANTFAIVVVLLAMAADAIRIGVRTRCWW